MNSETTRRPLIAAGTAIGIGMGGFVDGILLEQAVDNVLTDDSKLKVGGMIQISGIRFQYAPQRALGKRVLKIEPAKGP